VLTQKRAEIVRCLVEGNSIDATCRMTGAAKMTVLKLLRDLGDVTAAYQDDACAASGASGFRPMRFGALSTRRRRTSLRTKRDTFGYGDVWTCHEIAALLD